uniref:Methyltransferase FkbM domain-containing protein n=1 Tax=viral metagenome TaxID=1070528 RepID=A0A6C0HLL0_9ZZZZ
MIENFVKYIKNKNNNFIIFDVGSRDCGQSIEFYNTFPTAQIYAFECNPNTIDICKKNIEKYSDRITLIEGAVCDYDGTITFYPINQQKTITTWTDGNPGASSIFKSNGTYTHEHYIQDEIISQCHRLDSVMKKYNIPNVDIIWMDLQGAELLALKGLGNYLSTVKYIYTEVSHKAMYTGQVMFDELNNYILSAGFIIKNELSLSLSGWQEDVIYEKENVHDLTLFKKNKYSQRGHDGIIQQIMTILNIKAGFFIEFGAWDGIYLSNCRNLYENGWNGCFIEANMQKHIELVKNYEGSKGSKGSKVLCLQKYVYPTEVEGDTVDSLYKEYMNNIDIDLLSIDIDGRDYEIFENMELKPKLIIIEGGFLFHPCLRTKIPYNEACNNVQQPLFVLFELAKKKGYTPIVFNQDTFLLRTDLYETYNYFKNIKNDCYTLWKSAFYNILNESDRHWLINHRNTHNIVNKYENQYYLNLEDSLNNIFDIVIPIGPNDKDIIYQQIEYTKKNIIGYRNIYLICYDPTINIDGCITIDEKIFPFTIENIRQIHGVLDRNGWYLQQLLKLYALLIIPDILERCLIIDSDTFFLKPTVFIKEGKCLYNFGVEYHMPYFEHMLKLDKGLTKVDMVKSGICHHMMFEAKYVNELINKIEKEHNDKCYNVFLIAVVDYNTSGASEYEIYFNYMLKYHSDIIELRQLSWANVTTLNAECNLDYVSCHWYMKN